MKEITVKDIIEFLKSVKIEFQVKGNNSVCVDNFSSLNSLTNNKVTWVKYWTEDNIKKIEHKKDCVIIGRYEDAVEPEKENCFILCEDPKMCFFEILGRFFIENKKEGIAETAVVRTKKIGQNCSIGDYSVLGEQVSLGDNVKIGNHVTLQGKVTIGDNTVIESGTVIGKAGYGFYHNQAGHMKRVPHLGGVVIGKFVEIGANTCIDCGTMDDTIIGDYSKIDNECNIGHNVNIGKDVMVVAGCAICGSVQIGDGSYIAPNSSIKNQVCVGEKSFVGMQTAVLKELKPESSVFGVPSRPFERTYQI